MNKDNVIPLPRDKVEEIIVRAAESFRLDANLIRAIIGVESSWNTLAERFEAHTDRYVIHAYDYASVLGITKNEEEQCQKTSYGLMQVMGFKAREMGLTAHITTLCVEEIGIFYGCKFLRRLYDRYADEVKVIAAYNAGSAIKAKSGMFVNQQYVDKVHRELLKYRGLEH